jgi:hypothetical protein
MVVHVAAVLWILPLAFLLLFVPYVRFPWLLWNIYSFATGRHEEKSTFPLYYRLLQPTRLFDMYRELYADYFPIGLYRSEPLPPTRKYVFGYHPHGAGIKGMSICFGMKATGFTKLFPGLQTTFLVMSSAFKIPLWRSYMQLMGGKSVSRASCVTQLTKSGHDGHGKGNGIIISVGGSPEADLTRPNSMDIIANKRKGFVRVAVETGADIVPVIGFGENDMWDRPEPGNGIGERILRFLIRRPPDCPLIRGRISVFLPLQKPISVVVGSPIVVEQQDHPDEDYINKLHGLYIQGLEQIWKDWRDEFGIDPAVEFKIVG